MPNYQVIVQENGQRKIIKKNAPSVSEAEDLILKECPNASIVDISREMGIGEHCETVRRDYK